MTERRDTSFLMSAVMRPFIAALARVAEILSYRESGKRQRLGRRWEEAGQRLGRDSQRK